MHVCSHILRNNVSPRSNDVSTRSASKSRRERNALSRALARLCRVQSTTPCTSSRASVLRAFLRDRAKNLTMLPPPFQ